MIYNKLKAPEILIPAAVTFVAVLFTWLFVDNAFTVWLGDSTAIWDIAQVPISPDARWVWDGIPDSSVPYTYRILVPFIVRNLFGSSIVGFVFIGIASLLVSNYFIFRITQLYTRDVLVSSFLAIAFSTNLTIILSGIANTAGLGLPSFALLLPLVFIFLKHIIAGGNINKISWLLFSIFLLLGTLVKEWFLFLPPAFIAYLLYKRNIRDAVVMGFCSLPAAVAHLIIRLVMGPLFNDIQSFDIFQLIGPYINLEIGVYRQLFSTFSYSSKVIAEYHISLSCVCLHPDYRFLRRHLFQFPGLGPLRMKI